MFDLSSAEFLLCIILFLVGLVVGFLILRLSRSNLVTKQELKATREAIDERIDDIEDIVTKEVADLSESIKRMNTTMQKEFLELNRSIGRIEGAK